MGPAVVITLHFTDGSPFGYEEYEIFFGREDIPYQVGRSDASGRICFLPDHEGSWRIRTFSADGHGADFSFQAAPDQAPSARPAGWIDRYPRIFAGMGFILGLFGVLSLFLRRKG